MKYNGEDSPMSSKGETVTSSHPWSHNTCKIPLVFTGQREVTVWNTKDWILCSLFLHFETLVLISRKTETHAYKSETLPGQ